MKPTFLEVKAITDTLPIGFYANRRISATLKDKIPCSSYDPMKDIIEISYPQIIMGVDKVESAEEREEMIRSNYYHEVSHAILTPKDMRPTDPINIFEDERIETVLKDYYYGVDFEKSLRYINDFDPSAPLPTDPLAAFFYLVRYRIGRPDLLKEVEKIIRKYATLHRNADCYSWQRYRDEINNLYRIFDHDYRENPEKTMGMDGEGSGSDSEDEAEGSASGNPKEGINEDGKGKPAGGMPCKGDSPLNEKQIKELFDKVVNSPDNFNLDFHNKAVALFENFKKKNSKGSALQGHSGVINPRLADRADYKMFERSMTARGNNQFGSFHLNIFCDTSGSFSGADDEVNKIIKSLIIIENSNPNFTFDIITMSAGEKILPKEQRFICASGGNHLSEDIFPIFRKMQKPQTYNYNIVLFDGNAYSNDVNFDRVKRCEPNGRGFSAFAVNNCTLISDSSNQCWAERFCPTTRTIYTKFYVKELADNVLKALQMALN